MSAIKQLCANHCHVPPTPGRVRVGSIIGDLQKSFYKFPTPDDNFMLQIPNIWICIGIPKVMKILGQMPQPWGQMLTNRYKSPPIARPGVGAWGLTMIGALIHTQC